MHSPFDEWASIFSIRYQCRGIQEYPQRHLIEGNILNISSAIVYARPGTDATVRERLPHIPGVEVYAAAEDGRLIVIIEADNDRCAMDTYEAIARMDDVLNIAMIFQQTETHPDQELAKCK